MPRPNGFDYEAAMVSSGVVRLIELQVNGYSYVRPRARSILNESFNIVNRPLPY
jgi:hypothetical protein